MKILLINTVPNASYDDRKLPPLGIGYLSSNLDKKNNKCDILDFNINQHIEYDSLPKYIKNNKYDIVGFTVYTLMWEKIKLISKKIKEENPNVLIVCGGIHCTLKHDKIVYETPFVDVFMRGEGEVAFNNLVNDYRKNKRLTLIDDGCTYNKNIFGKIIFAKRINYIENLDMIAFPNRPRYEEYSKTGNLINVSISSSRGCPYCCKFCSIPTLKLKWRGRSADNVSQEVYKLYKNNPSIFVIFVDDNFFVNSDRSIEVIKEINKKCKAIIPFPFATRADQILRAGLKKLIWLKEHGCCAIEVGIENGSNDFLKRVNKKISVEENEKALNLLKTSNINIGIDFILFDNKSTMKELRENLSFFKRNNLMSYFPPRLYNRVFPYPGTGYEGEIDYKNYFDNNDVLKVYNALKEFEGTLQVKINSILNRLNYKKDISK